MTTGKIFRGKSSGKADPRPSGNRAVSGSQLNADSDSEDLSSSLSMLQAQVAKALLERPTMSIRAKLTLGFLLFFFLSTGATLTAYATLNRLEKKINFLEIADRYTTEIQQARRFENNFFLYGTNLEDVLDHVHNATRLLMSGKDELEGVIGREKFRLVEQHQYKYTDILEQLKVLQKDTLPGILPQHPDIEAELREHGAAMVTQALELAEGERKSVNVMLKLFKRLPLAFLTILLPLIIYTANFLARQMLRPLGRMMDATQRIANGDFTPIPPARRFRDEFTNLAIALNHMMEELQRRHDILVKSHKLRAVGTLTAGIAHELNNPINNITLTSAMLEEDYKTLDDAERSDMINDLVMQAERAGRIVRNLLDFARESEMQSQLLDVGEMIRETVRLTNNEIKLKKATVDLNIPETLPPVIGDKQLLIQVFINLILNALDAMTGGDLLKIDISKPSSSEYVIVRVKDNGKGIPEHILPNVFDPFFTTKHTGKGTGLGLSVSVGIIKKHGGDIRVKSTHGKGSTFTVLLPVTSIPAQLDHK